MKSFKTREKDYEISEHFFEHGCLHFRSYDASFMPVNLVFSYNQYKTKKKLFFLC